MITRAALVAEARAWVGTPYHHLAAMKDAGCDCLGLIMGIAMGLGLLPPTWRPTTYLPPTWFLHSPAELLLDALRASALLQEHSQMPLDCGDILAYAWGGRPVSHVALLTHAPPAPALLHAWRPAGRVIEHGLAGRWARDIRAVFRFAGVAA